MNHQNPGLFTVLAIVAVVLFLLAGGMFLNRMLTDPPESAESTESTELTESHEIPELTESLESQEIPESTEFTESAKSETLSLEDLRMYPNGDYIVGKDIPAGFYLLIANHYENTWNSGEYEDYGDLYFEVYQNSKISSSSKLRADWVQNSHYLELEDGQHLHFSHAELYHVPDDRRILPDAFRKSGMYQVGRDLEPGDYELTGHQEYGGSYAVYDSAKPGAVPVYVGNYIDIGTTDTVRLAEGQFLEMSFCRISRKLPDASVSSDSPDAPELSGYSGYLEGAYVIGEDLPAGLYVAVYDETGNGVFNLNVYAQDALDESAVIGGYSRNFRYVDLQDGQYLTFSKAQLYPVQTKSAPLGDPYGKPGMYLVGRDLPAGTYTIEPESGLSGDFGMTAVYDSAGADAKLLFSGLIRSETGTVEVHDGEFLELRNCHLKRE